MLYKCEMHGPYGPRQTAERRTFVFKTEEERQKRIQEKGQLETLVKTWHECETPREDRVLKANKVIEDVITTSKRLFEMLDVIRDPDMEIDITSDQIHSIGNVQQCLVGAETFLNKVSFK